QCCPDFHFFQESLLKIDTNFPCNLECLSIGAVLPSIGVITGGQTVQLTVTPTLAFSSLKVRFGPVEADTICYPSNSTSIIPPYYACALPNIAKLTNITSSTKLAIQYSSDGIT